MYRVLVGKPGGKRPLGRPRRRWEDGIRMDLRETGWGVKWIQLAQDRGRWRALVNTVINLRVLVPRSYTTVVQKPKGKGKIPHGRPRRRWEENIKMDVKKHGVRM
jgi:hypothetical protein